MSALVDRIAEVLRPCALYGIDVDLLAERVAEALQLTEEWGIWYADTLDEPMPGNRRSAFWAALDDPLSDEIKALISRFPKRAYGRRWVSEWITEQEKS